MRAKFFDIIPMSRFDREIKTRMVIIGGGVGGLGLAINALRRGIDVTLLDNQIPGTTHAATGILDARPDYLIKDVDLVKASSLEVDNWKNLLGSFSHIIRPLSFYMPLGKSSPHGLNRFSALMNYFEKLAIRRTRGLPHTCKVIPIHQCEVSEPNLLKNHFTHALKFWLWTVNPDELLSLMRLECSSSLFRLETVTKINGYTVKNGMIQEVFAENGKETLKVCSDRKSLIVVNCCGPWINDPLKELGIKIPIELRLGIQIKVPGYHIQSGILSFTQDQKYTILLQQKDYLQVGPTNTLFDGPPRLITKEEGESAISYTRNVLENVLCFDKLPQLSVLKYGWRVRPLGMTETDRPIIWHHAKEGVDNLYTLLPGKMALGLLAGRELVERIAKDGFVSTEPQFSIHKTYSMDGHSQNSLFLEFNRLKSILLTGWNILKPHR